MEKVTKYHYGRHLMSKKPIEAKRKPIKIKYISSPMMFQANSASEFRAIVQELTGQNSDHTTVSIPNSQTTTTTPSPSSSTINEEAAIWVGNHEALQTQSVTENTSVKDEYSSIITFLSQFDDEGGRHFTTQVSESFNFQSPCDFAWRNNYV